MKENLPIMVISEESSNRITFRFKGNRWAVATLIPGLLLVALASKMYLIGNPSNVLQAIIGILGMLLIYSSVYSFSSSQWLTADGCTKTIRFYKKNIYGLVNWEKSKSDFKEISVLRQYDATNWLIILVCNDGLDLYIGENVFGALSYEKALEIANKVSSKTDIHISVIN
jgi:nicotinamide riboside transporter PnuC